MRDDMPPISRNTAVHAARELQVFSSTRQLTIRVDWDKALADLNADTTTRAFHAIKPFPWPKRPFDQKRDA